MKIVIIKSGDKFGRLTVINEELKIGVKRYFKCLCECGKEKKIHIGVLRNGMTRSCGCLVKENIKKVNEGNRVHSMSKDRIYRIWTGMKQRCLNENNDRFKDYGGRGVKLSDEWVIFENFYKDMHETYSKNLTLDRINNNGDYCKENCKWSTKKEQSRNMRTNNLISFNGKTLTITQLAEINGLKVKTLETRIKRGWGIEKALITPCGKYILKKNETTTTWEKEFDRIHNRRDLELKTKFQEKLDQAKIKKESL